MRFANQCPSNTLNKNLILSKYSQTPLIHNLCQVYVDAEAVAFHKEQSHFALWTNFKESGGVKKSTSYKTDGLFMT